MKRVKAVAPYIHPEFLNFKIAPYEAWKRIGGQVAEAHYPARIFHGFAFRWELPTLWKNKKEARLRFVEPVSLSFDTFPDYARYEIIPFVWDCWPRYFERMCRWLEKHEVKTAIFTSSQTADVFKQKIPQLNVLWCPEAISTELYKPGFQLKERVVDILEFGRQSGLTMHFNNSSINVVYTKKNNDFIYTTEQLYDLLQNTKVAIAFPRSITQPDVAGGIETLTQRYWECMLSRCLMIGHCPKELINLIGYNPVVELQIDSDNVSETLMTILNNITDYQELVDKNRETALIMGDWNKRIIQVQQWLSAHGYIIYK